MSTAAAPEGEKILIVDDDPGLRRLLERFLSEQGYRVRAVENVEQMDRLLARELFQLLVLDLMLPGEDGLSACRRLREANNQMPIIMLTAKGDEASRIQGLEGGADDYLAKPFNPRELLARIKAVLRRQAPVVPGAPASEDETVSFGEYELSLATRELKKGDEVHMLTTGEFAVLKALVQHAREPLTAANAVGELLAVALFEERLVVVEVELRGAARLEKVNHPLRLGRMVEAAEHTASAVGPALLRRRRPAQHLCQCEATESHADRIQQFPPVHRFTTLPS